ncbi:ABC transporter [Devosia epidermidihirudinis]|uniref:ABC transporter n=1 Tax=Devosia epidermidihirudinis TaxID=1293439 RepID=A0A0F5QCV1_9HYPH|nr:ABC transporter ATP-binding protein [Devosia epidermidihirudinis]KKC38790.1 ABC transporter [Devosia epidermidihirudinis]
MKLTATNLSFGYGHGLIGEAVDITINGGVTCLLGPNGAGKTTLFKTMLGLLTPSHGTVTLDEKPLTNWRREDLARAVAYVPQAHAVLFPFTVRDVVLMGRAARVPAFAAPSRSDIAIADACLDRLGLSHLADRPYTEISGGERQIALIARALAQEPSILIMDEPTASLDYGNQLRVLSHVRTLASQGISVVLSTHNPEHALLCADRVALFHERRIIAIGAPGDVLTAAAIKQLYGVDVVIGRLPGSAAATIAPVPFDKEIHNGP